MASNFLVQFFIFAQKFESTSEKHVGYLIKEKTGVWFQRFFAINAPPNVILMVIVGVPVCIAARRIGRGFRSPPRTPQTSKRKIKNFTVFYSIAARNSISFFAPFL